VDSLSPCDRCWLNLDKGCHSPFCPFHCTIKSSLQSPNKHNTVHSICNFKCTKEDQILSPSSVPFLKMLSSKLLRCFRFPITLFILITNFDLYLTLLFRFQFGAKKPKKGEGFVCLRLLFEVLEGTLLLGLHLGVSCQKQMALTLFLPFPFLFYSHSFSQFQGIH